MPRLTTSSLDETVDAMEDLLVEIPLEDLDLAYVAAKKLHASQFPMSDTEIYQAWKTIDQQRRDARQPYNVCSLCHTAYGSHADNCPFHPKWTQMPTNEENTSVK